MKLKKVLSLLLAMGSLATASSCFNCKVKADEKDVKERIKEYQIKNNLSNEEVNYIVDYIVNLYINYGPIFALNTVVNLFNDQYNVGMLHLYNLVVSKCLSTVADDSIIANIFYVEKMRDNIDEYEEDVAKYY